MFGKKFIMGLLCLFIFVGFIGTAEANKSVFIISKHGSPSKAEAFSIDGDEVTFQAMVDISTYNQGYGAVGNAVWPDKDLMFVTYESSDMLVWSSTKTLEKVGEFDTDIPNPAGVVVDREKELIYIIWRNYEDLYVYSFDDVNNTVVLENTYELETSSGYIDGWGLALDEENDLLYVTDESNKVHYYDTNDWSLEGDIDISVSGTERPAVGIAVDPANGYLYTGHWTGHNYLVRTSTSSPYTSIEVEIEGDYYSQPLIGVDVDEDTGLVYCTTYHHDFRVYDSNLVLKDTETNDDISGPGGVAVGGWYKTPSFALVKDNNDPNDECVRPFIDMGMEDNYLVYDICWDANDHADTNVVLIDYLPKECDYYSSDPSGDYNSTDHTVTWDLEDIGDDDANCFELKTKVNYWARPGDTFTNLVIMEGDTYRNEATEDCNVCNWGSEIIYVDEDANDPNSCNNGTDWYNAYTDLRDAFTGAENLGAAVTAIWVAAGTYKPVWDVNEDNYKDYSFELLKDVGLFGHFGGVGTYETSTNQRDFSDPNNETVLDGKIGENYNEQVYYVLYGQNIEDAIVDGFTITGAYYDGIYFDDCDGSVVNCKIKNNNRYGIYCYNYSYPDIHNCTFIDNENTGLYITYYCWPEISSCVFDGNDNTYDGIYIGNSVVGIEDSIFENHTDDGVEGSDGTLTVIDCDFSGDNDNAIQISDITTTVTNCSIKNCGDDGIYASDSDLTIDHSVISNNSDNALYTTGGCNLTLKNSVVRYSGESGLELNGNYATTIKNNWIHNNGTDEYAYYGGAGIWFTNQVSVPLVRNNTIYDNYTYGIQSSEQGADPNVINCIIYGNDSNDFYREDGTFDTVNYCNLWNSHDGTGNITGDPGFMNVGTDPNDLHLDETSQCKNAGDPNGDYGDETDIDGESRIKYGRVDIGADEYYYSLADFDEDGKVNLVDYAIIAGAWQTEPNDNNYEEDCDIEDNNSIDYNDVALFCEDWLWEKGWDEGWMMCMGGGMGFGGLESASILESSKTALTDNRDALMLPTATESLKARPERLVAKSQKFYDITPIRTISGKQKLLELERILDRISTEIILKQFDEMWYKGQLKEIRTEYEYLEFRKTLEVPLR